MVNKTQDLFAWVHILVHFQKNTCITHICVLLFTLEPLTLCSLNIWEPEHINFISAHNAAV